jgi:predicted NBD/HSP70 family sugar kinase
MLRRAGKDPVRGRAAVDELIDEATCGERAALGALAEHGRWLGIGIAGLVNMLAPDVIVLGGLLHRTYPFVIAEIEAEVDHRALDALREGVRVVQSDLGIDSSLIGAAELAWFPVLADPAAVRRAGASST